jgi:dihydroorotate dehydrogenase (NAD+) catalytic subunit
MGGIACADDALEFLLAGAAAVQVGSANFVNPLVMPEIINGIENYMREYGYTTISQLSIRRDRACVMR